MENTSYTQRMRNDHARLNQLRELMVLDSLPEKLYTDLANLLRSNLAVPISMVNLLDVDRDWFKASSGIDLTESPASTSFCEVFFNSDQDVIVVPDTMTDARFADHPLVTGGPNIRFYVAARLKVNGQTMGTLCGYDTKPRQLDVAAIEDLKLMAAAATAGLASRTKSSESGELVATLEPRVIHLVDSHIESAQTLCELLTICVRDADIRLSNDWNQEARAKMQDSRNNVLIIDLSDAQHTTALSIDKVKALGVPRNPYSIAIADNREISTPERLLCHLDEVLNKPLEIEQLLKLLQSAGFSVDEKAISNNK